MLVKYKGHKTNVNNGTSIPLFISYVIHICFVQITFSGHIIKCTLWGKYAEQLNKFICNNKSTEMVIAILQHAKLKKFNSKFDYFLSYTHVSQYYIVISMFVV